MKRYLVLLCLLPVLLAANEYTLDQMIDHGLQNSFQIRKQELNHTSSKSSLNSAKWNLLPNAELNAGLNQDFDPISPKSGLTSSAGIEISKSISLNDASFFNYKQAEVDSKIANLELERSYSDYAYQVIQAYLETLSATKRKSALEENLAIQTRVYEQSQVLLQLGKTTPFEVKQSEIAVMNSNISIIQLENTIANARAKLFSLAQMQDEGYPLADIETDTDKSIPPYNTDSITEIKLLEFSLKKNDLNLTQSNLDYLPKVSLSYGYSRRVSGEDFDLNNYNSVHGIGLNLSYSIWNFFTNKESSTRQKINKQSTLLSIEDIKDQTRRNYDNSIQELEYLLRLDELYRERLEQSQEQIRIAEERYRLGMIQLLELDKTRTEYIDSDIQYNANRYQIIQKQEELNHLLSQKIMGKW
ncbi:MAG: TolC family protein [Candidatus Cloacimonetes bacterium]|jgi:outer membrane protein TolC|nr:TolC family protein [Candidatus Cloacimonadota bacterium]MDD2506601.1 TolC family protein [Candidatus Cloacimonadota bacterium]MDD4560196.1 TolC family protein [Candidatus Cloacimonadota bacterium]